MPPTPEQALNILTQIVEAHLLTGPQRRAAESAIATLHAAITPKPPTPAPAATATPPAV